MELSKYILDRGGDIVWYSKDIRGQSMMDSSCSSSSSSSSPPGLGAGLGGRVDSCRQLFAKALDKVSGGGGPSSSSRPRPIVVSLDMTVCSPFVHNNHAHRSSNHGLGGSNSSLGLTADELMDIAFLCGINPNVKPFSLFFFYYIYIVFVTNRSSLSTFVNSIQRVTMTEQICY
jgi:hypothetical protein